MDDNFKYTIQNSTAGGNWQQDLGTTVAASLTSLNSGIFNVTYNQATGSRLRVIAGTRFPFPWNVATNKPQTISELGVFTDVPNNYFFCSFVYVLQDFKSGEAARLRTSTIAFATIEEARAYTWDTLKGYSPTLSDNEIRQHLKCIWEVKGAWDAGCKYAALRETQYIRQNPLTATSQSTSSVTAANVSVDVTLFNGNLASTDTNQQSVNQKLDDLPIAKRRIADLANSANVIDIDWNSLHDFNSSNRVAISANASITYVNATNAQFATFKVLISNLATITFPTGSISGDTRISSRVFTPTANGNYTISIYKTTTEYEIVISTNPAI